MNLGQILFELCATQKRTKGRKDGWMDKGKSKSPIPKVGAQKDII
jgi:hypothetical protein